MTQKSHMPANRQNMPPASMPTAGPFPLHRLIGAIIIRHDISRNRLPHHNIPRQKPIPRKRNPLPEPRHRPIHHIRRQLLPPSRSILRSVGQLIQPHPPLQQPAAIPIRSRQTPPKISRIQLKSDPKLPLVIQANRALGFSLRPRQGRQNNMPAKINCSFPFPKPSLHSLPLSVYSPTKSPTQ